MIWTSVNINIRFCIFNSINYDGKCPLQSRSSPIGKNKRVTYEGDLLVLEIRNINWSVRENSQKEAKLYADCIDVI